MNGSPRPLIIGKAHVNPPNRFPVLLPVAGLAFAALHLAYEHFTGGVQSHNLLNRPDLPAISNWLGLVTLPLLGVVLGLRIRSHPSPARFVGMPRPVLTALAGAFLYGGVLAASFELGASGITSVAFIGLFVVALALPVYRAEYVTGFVTGMTVTFGGVLPLLVAVVVASFSFVVRYSLRLIAALLGKKRAPPEVS
jgi:hypothetical protein